MPVGACQPSTARPRDGPIWGARPISDDEPRGDDPRAELVRERAARLAAERELAELQAQKRHLESRAIGARQTLAYGLGRALIEARSLKGLLALPARIRTLRLRQKAKRKLRVPDTVPGDVAQRMRLVDEILERAATEGVDAAARAAGKHPDRAQRGRALAELALFALDDAPDKACDIALEAAASAPGEARLLALVARLRGAGMVSVPARIGATIGDAQPLSAPQRQWLDGLAAEAARLAGEPPARAPAARKREPGPIAHLALVAPESWRGHPRIVAAGQAAHSAGLSVGFGRPDSDGAEWGMHVFPDSLDFAEQALAGGGAARALLLDLANGLPDVGSGADSEAARAGRLRLDAAIAAADTVVVRGPAARSLAEAAGAACAALDDAWPDAEPPGDEAVAAARLEFGFDAGPTLLATADLSAENGLERLLGAFGELAEEGAASGLAILGSGPAAPLLAQIAAEHGLEERAVFVGRPAFERWPALFACCDAAIFPSQFAESLGSTVPLAMLLAAELGLAALHSEAAWASRTSQAIDRAPLGDDWAGAMRRALALEARPRRSADCDRLANLYARLRDG